MTARPGVYVRSSSSHGTKEYYAKGNDYLDEATYWPNPLIHQKGWNMIYHNDSNYQNTNWPRKVISFWIIE